MAVRPWISDERALIGIRRPSYWATFILSMGRPPSFVGSEDAPTMATDFGSKRVRKLGVLINGIRRRSSVRDIL